MGEIKINIGLKTLRMDPFYSEAELTPMSPDSDVPTAPPSIGLWVFLVLFLLALVAIGVLLYFVLHNKKKFKDCEENADEAESRLRQCCAQFSAGGQTYCDGYGTEPPVIGRPVPDVVIGRPVPEPNEEEFSRAPFVG